jgi:hypothetical protein
MPYCYPTERFVARASLFGWEVVDLLRPDNITSCSSREEAETTAKLFSEGAEKAQWEAAAKE